MYIVSQDRDKIIKYNGEELFSLPVMYNNVIIGINLYMQPKEFLGTFMTVSEACNEMQIIKQKYRDYVK